MFMSFVDREVLCVDCGVTFVFSAGEQDFFRDKGFTHDPKHCQQCKAKRANGSVRRRIEMHITCSECGIDTTVPFKPTQGRPVLCATCFSRVKRVLPAGQEPPPSSPLGQIR